MSTSTQHVPQAAPGEGSTWNTPEAGEALASLRVIVQQMADDSQTPMVIGWQFADHAPGGREIGYCPAAAAGPAFVVEVIETITPHRGRSGYQARQVARREGLQAAAERARQEADARYRNARRQVENIPLGQPILVGHHSERGHRAALKRYDNNMRASVNASARAAELAGRAFAVGDAGISSDDPTALTQLRQQLVEMEARRDAMKLVNKLLRKHKGKPEACQAALLELGYAEGEAVSLMHADRLGHVGYPAYTFTNLGANIRRVEQRIKSLSAIATVEEGVRDEHAGCEYRIEENRVQLRFPGKPSDAVRSRLKSQGFRWSPTSGAWQRLLNNAGIYQAREFMAWWRTQEQPK